MQDTLDRKAYSDGLRNVDCRNDSLRDWGRYKRGDCDILGIEGFRILEQWKKIDEGTVVYRILNQSGLLEYWLDCSALRSRLRYVPRDENISTHKHPNPLRGDVRERDSPAHVPTSLHRDNGPFDQLLNLPIASLCDNDAPGDDTDRELLTVLKPMFHLRRPASKVASQHTGPGCWQFRHPAEDGFVCHVVHRGGISKANRASVPT